jgi:hypothetical protein
MYLFFAATVCNGMNNESPTSYSQLTTIQKPKQAIYLATNQIVVNDENGCSIIDPKTDKKIITITNEKCHHLAIHPKEPLLALTHNKTLTIFNHKAEKIWSKTNDHHIISSIFNPHDTIITLKLSTLGGGDKIMQHNYQNNQSLQLYNYPTTYHPLEKIVATLRHQTIYFYLNGIPSPSAYSSEQMRLPVVLSDCKYNSNGSHLVIRSTDDFCLQQNNSVSEFFKEIIPDHYYVAMEFHPNDSVLTLLSKDFLHQEITLYYWDAEQQQIIKKITLPYIELNSLVYNTNPTIFFAPNGTELLFTAYHQHMIFSVPVEVIFRNEEKNMLIYHLLQNMLLKELTLLILKNMLPGY